jgi:methylglutaconyl-CoA hydratase
MSEITLGFGPFVIAPAVERKIGAAAFGALAIDAAHWRSAEWAQKRGLFAELHHTTEGMDESVTRLAHNLAHSNPEAMAELKQMLWRDTDHWDKLLTERASVSGRLALSEFTRDAIAKFKK